MLIFETRIMKYQHWKAIEYEKPSIGKEEIEKRLKKNIEEQDELLDLSNAVLENLPTEIYSFKWLKMLYLVRNNLTTISPHIRSLENLEKLWLGWNSRFNKFPTAITQLKKLSTLQIGGSKRGLPTKIKNIPAEIGKLKNLEKLDLGNNIIEELPKELFELENLKELILFGNKIKSIPKDILRLKKLKNIRLDGNPLINPPFEIANQGVEAIKDWFYSPKIENNEIKLIITGNTTAGKTTLVNFLTKEEYIDTTNSTHGIKIKKWKVNDLNVNIWDFGGQEYYHATHRLFLTSNSIYILLWEKSKNKSALIPTKIKISGKDKIEVKELQHYDYSYWLKLIRKFDINPEKSISPLFMVQNKIDELGNEHEPTDNILITDFAVTGDFHISIKNAFAEKDDTDSEFMLQFRLFRNKLLRTLQETSIGKEIQLYIANVRKAIQLKEGENIWNWETYQNFCNKEAKAEMTVMRIKILTQYLHDTGVILYFGYDEKLPPDSVLRDTVFINPKYVCDTIYDILDYKVQENNGKFTEQQVIEKFEDKNIAERFLALMQSPNFELIFQYPDEPETYYATQYLPNKIERNEWFDEILSDLDIALVIEFRTFFTISLMTRFIARYGFESEKKWFAKEEILLKRDKVRVYIECNVVKQKITIKTSPLNKTHSVIKEIFNNFIQLFDSNKGIELSLDNKTFDSLELIKERSEKYPEYEFLFIKHENFMSKKLSNEQFKNFQQILMDIYTTTEELSNFVRIALGENRNKFAGGDDLQSVTYKLISWAEAKGRIGELIKATMKENNKDIRLNQFSEFIETEKTEERDTFNRTINQQGEKSVYIEKNEGNITIN